MTLTNEDRDFLKEWVVDPLTVQIKAIHSSPCDEITKVKVDVREVRDRQNKWAGGLAILVGVGSLLMAFKDNLIGMLFRR